MLSGLNLACAGRLEQAQAAARNLLGVLVALPLVIDFQAGPLIRVHSPDFGSFEFAVGCRLRCEQLRLGSVDPWFSKSTSFSVSMGTRGSAHGSCPDLMLNRIEFALGRIARASGDCRRAEND